MRPFLLVGLLASACAALPPPEPPPGGGDSPCYGSTRDWRAWVDAMPGTERPGLIVTGTVTTPTGGHRSVLTLGPTTRSDPPQQFVNLEIRAQGNVVTAAVTTEEVRARFPALPRYGAVIILCNGREVGRIGPVEIAH
ncbi:MAG TPA: hypothetical protein VD887_04680 [Allosphingosinicella sp.]|nr:hypothetical protein [Allosphingosinicella sp.]